MDPDEIKEHDSALIIWGGADIHPDFYGHSLHRTTYPGGRRDNLEWALMQRAIERGIPIIGICRGAQMACAAAGGWLIQDVHNHASGSHSVTTHDGFVFRVNSIHHQMMVPDNTEHELIGWSSDNRSTKRESRYSAVSTYYGVQDNQEWTPPVGWREPEFVYFPKIHAYAIQWHPEGMEAAEAATQYVLKFIKTKEDSRSDKP